MIENPRDIAKLLSLNVDLDYLMKNPDANTPQRIFDAIAKKMHEMQYCLVHKEDLREVQEPEEAPLPPVNKIDLSSTLVPIESDKS